MAEFVFDEKETYWYTCSIHVAKDRRAEKKKIDVEFRRLDQEAVDAMMEDINAQMRYQAWSRRNQELPEEERDSDESYDKPRGKTLKEFVHAVVVGWGVVKQSNGEKIEFSHDALDVLLNKYPGAAQDIYTDFTESVRAGRRGN